jgi:hypothetical protein
MSLDDQGQDQFLNYRWEFLRRNQDYIEEFEELVAILEEKYDGVWRSDFGTMSQEETDFCIKWKIGQPISPRIGIKNLKEIPDLTPTGREIALRNLYHQLQPIRDLIPVGDHTFYFQPGKAVRLLDYDLEELTDKGKIRMEIEVNLNGSKRMIMREFGKHMDKWADFYMETITELLREAEAKNRRDQISTDQETNKLDDLLSKELKERKKKFNRKMHYDNFDNYLAVYDLRREGKSWSKIQKALDLNSIQTARDHYESAKKLIRKGLSR